MNEDNRYSDRFNLSHQQFQDYKDSKVTRLIPYVIGMIICSIFIDKWTGWIVLTVILIASYWNDAKQEEQWLKDGNVTKEDLR